MSFDRLAILGNGLLIAGVLTAAVVLPPSGSEVAVFVAPWSADTSAIDVVARAGGALVATGRPWVAVAISDDPHFIARLYQAGALLVAAPQLAAGCTDPIHRS